MPLTFPFHQGLILPLWRRFPNRIDCLALCIGAAMPDVVDGIAGLFRGGLGQWLGHSLIGVFVCVPAGLILLWLARRILPRKLLARLGGGPTVPAGLARPTLSVAVGDLSLLAFDLVTHGNFLLLWPWYVNDRAFPSWWYHSWGSIPLPGYRDPYPFAPFTITWILLTLVGIVLFLLCLRRPPVNMPRHDVRR
jgi:hypothetical protein